MPTLRAGLHRRVDLVGLALADQVAHRGRRARAPRRPTQRPAPSAVGSSCWVMTPCSATDSCTRTCCLLVRREDVDDAVDRLRRVLGVQRGEDEVAGLRRGQRGRDRLEVAHLADEDHVGVLAQRGLQAPARSVGASAPSSRWLTMQLLVAVEELDRVLDGDDVLLARLVDLVDHRGQRRRLARAGRAGDEHEAARLAWRTRGRPAAGRASSIGDDLDGDQAEGGADRGALEVGVDAEAGATGDRVGEVELPVGLQPLALVVGEDRVDDLARVRRASRTG